MKRLVSILKTVNASISHSANAFSAKFCGSRVGLVALIVVSILSLVVAAGNIVLFFLALFGLGEPVGSLTAVGVFIIAIAPVVLVCNWHLYRHSIARLAILNSS